MTPARPSQEIATAQPAAVEYLRAARAPNTRRAYAAALADFIDFQDHAGRPALPASPAAVAAYLANLAKHGAAVATIEQRHAAISAAHRTAGMIDPADAEAVALVMAGIRRKHAAPPDKRAPIGPAQLESLLAAIQAQQPAAALRNRALILLGFAGAFRRSELVALNRGDLNFTDSGLAVKVRRSKTDQTGRGMTKQIPSLPGSQLDPAAAVRAWLDFAGWRPGPLFVRLAGTGAPAATRLTAQSVSLIIKDAARAAGLDPDHLAAHSLRSGFITAAFSNGSAEWEVQQQTGHKSTQVLRSYIQDAGQGASRAAAAAFQTREKTK